MNPANFNVGGGMPTGAPAHGQMPKVDNQVMMNYVAQALQAQGTYTGWRAEVPFKDRVVRVYQMFTSLRLIQPQADLQNLAQAALSFEQKAFKDAQQKVDYDKECNDKLLHIRDTRARQAAVIQNGMMPQGGPKAAGMRGVGQPPFPQQMSRAMQANPMAGQQPMAMGMNDPNQVAMQQQRPQQPQSQQQQQALLQQQQQQRAQQRPGGGAALPDELHNLSAAEYEHVCRVASQIMAKTPHDDVEKIKSNLQNMNPEQRRYLNQKGMDPVAYFFRSQALAQLRRHKRNRMEAARAQNAGVDPNNPMMGEMLNPQQRQMFQNMMGLQRNSAFPMGAQQGLDSSFLGNVENIQGQQADGLRSQEAGQLVVPASSSQINQNLFNGNQQNVFPTNQPMNQGGQANNMGGATMNPQFFAQQHLQNASNVPQDRTQPTGTPFQPQAQAQNQAQARAQAAQKAQAQMAISQAGQANTHLQQQQPPIPQQQSPPLSMLNRPMAPGQMSPAQVAAQVRPPSRAPAMGQQPSMGGQQPMQGRPQIPQGLSPAVQEQLAQMTPEQISMFLHQRRAMATNPALARANANQQSMPMQQNLSQSAQGQPMPNPQNMRALNLQQQLAAGMAAGNTGQPSNPMMPAQQLSSAQQQQQRQEMYKMQLLRQQSGSLEMSMEQSKEMDRLHFPPSILSNNANMVSPVPKHIKTWGHLKQWAASNSQLLGGMDLQKLMALQKFHFAQIMAQSKERNRSADQMAQGNWMPGPGQAKQPQQQQLPPQQQQQQQQQPGQQQPPQPMMNPRQFPGGQQPNLMNMQVRPINITPEEILHARSVLSAQGAQHQHLSDDNVRDLLSRQRQKQLIQMAQNRAAQAQLAAQQGQQTQTQQPTPATATAVGAQGKVDPSGQQQPPHHQPQPQPPAQPVPAAPTAKAPAANKGAKGAANKQAGKRKLPAEEAAEAQNNNNNAPNNNTTNNNQKAPAAPPGGAVPGGPSRPNMPFTPKQLAAMPPQQRAQIEAHMRRQQGQTRTRAAAEEAWNNLPEKIRQAYHSTLEQAPPPKPQPITPEQKAAMVQQLRDCTDMLGRMDTLVQWFAKIPNQEKNVRSLLAMRIQLMRQFKPTPDWTLNDDLTITPEYLTMTINYVKKLFHAMITRVSQHQNQVPGARPGGPQAVPAGMQQPPNQNNMPALNASNLQQLQQQEEALQRARRASSQTAVSATSAVPPAPFGAPSPQGVPHAYGPGSMPPEQLKLPPMKKRKQSHAGATPTSATPGSKPAVIKPADAKMPAATLGGGAYTCSVPECQHHLQGFPTQAALDKHVEESHKEDAIEDPLAFALDSFRSGLVKPGDPPDSIAMTTTLKKDAQPLPMGATPATSGTTPMGRLYSQQQPPSQGLTPQVPTSKGPSAPTPTTKGSEGKKDGGRPSEPTPSMEATLKDPWADSAISLESIHDAFVDLGDDGGLGFGAMDEFLNADMFTNTQDTPDSVESAPVTQTPKDGEAPRLDDAISKAVDGPPEDNWIPADWISFPGPFEDEFLLNQPVIDIDWDAVERGDVNDSAVALHAM